MSKPDPGAEEARLAYGGAMYERGYRAGQEAENVIALRDAAGLQDHIVKLEAENAALKERAVNAEKAWLDVFQRQRERAEKMEKALEGIAPKLMLWCEDCGHTIFADGRVEKSYEDDEGLCDNCTLYLEATNEVRRALGKGE